MGKTSYKNTKELIKELSNQLDNLDRGNLELEDLNRLVENGQELYEQLVILRYKAFDKYGAPKSPAAEIEEKPIEKAPEKADEAIFDFTEMSTPEVQNDPQPSFDFSIDPEAVEKDEKVAPQKKSSLSDETEGNSLHDALKSGDDLSLRKKFQNTPVTDIKSNISIAKKFEYISNMFDGNSAVYEESIEFLNTCATGDDARLKLNELTTKFSWDLEDKSIIKFIELVERRYL